MSVKDGPIKIVLASQSPRRAELMKFMGLPFAVATAAVDEAALQARLGDCGEELLVLALAEAKAKAVQALAPEALVIAADTMVRCEGRMLGKPKDAEDARRMLHFLAGKSHEVLTAVSLLSPMRNQQFCASTKVRFYPLDARMEAFIEAYVESQVPMDKAGAYGIQDAGAYLVAAVEGDFYTVMGLPVARLWRAIEGILEANESIGKPV